jgi:bifunctional DNase/RNase
MAQLVEMVVESVRVHMPSSQHVVILKELDHERYLPIWIGPWEANAIAMKLQGVSSERPLTHDLFSTTLDELGVTVRRVVISSLAEETFHAQLFLQSGDRELEVDSRPSDALALAVRAGVRIYAADEVLDRAGVRPEDGDAGSIEDLESTGDPTLPADPRLEVFRDFINSLDLGGDAGTREGPRPE